MRDDGRHFKPLSAERCHDEEPLFYDSRCLVNCTTVTPDWQFIVRVPELVAVPTEPSKTHQSTYNVSVTIHKRCLTEGAPSLGL